MKLLIQKLTKEEYNKVYLNYIATDRGKEQLKRLNRLLIMGIICLFLAVIYFLYNSDMGITNIILIITLIIFANFFMISSIVLKRKSLNNYLIKNPNILKQEKKSSK